MKKIIFLIILSSFSFSGYAKEKSDNRHSVSKSINVKKTEVSKAKHVLRIVEEEDETFCVTGSQYIGLLDITMYCVNCESSQLAAEIANADCMMDMSMWELAWECYYSGC